MEDMVDGDAAIGSNMEFQNQASNEESVNDKNNLEVPFKDLSDDWIPECPQDKIPVLEQQFSDIDSAFEFYKEYGRACGFDVRRSSGKSDQNKKLRRKYFVCSRAGLNLKKDPEENSSIQRRRRTGSIKCECPAQIAIGIKEGNRVTVKKFIERHNHSFVGKGEMQFLRCSRSLTEFQKRWIFDAKKSNIGATRAHILFKNMIGSYENVGATVVDFKNFARDIKQYIGKHDADMIIQKFKDIQETSDSQFRFEYNTDSNNHLTQLFWADGVGRRNFEVFGDVVSFDATYRTNRYGMVFIPFIGIDNHWKSVTFAAALLEKENVTNYKWACEAVKKVFGDSLKCIITYQDPAMKIAIADCFPGVKHRLCMWHIMKKFPAKLGPLFCAETEFMDNLNNFVWSDHASPEEFEEGWNKVLADFNQSDNSWLKELFDLRESWVPAFFNDEPMVGLLRTTSRSESSNFYFNHFVEKGDTLSEFYLCYHSAIEKQRNINSKLNHGDDSMPTNTSKKKIENDAAEMYTRTMFYKIQEEIDASTREMEIGDMSVTDNVKKMDVKDPFKQNRIFEVTLNLQTHDIDCSCKLYTRVGYLCSHAFLLLGISAIPFIPRQYVNNRWLKKAEVRFTTLELGDESVASSEDEAKRAGTRDCWFEFQGCMSDASGVKERIDFVHKNLKSIRIHLKESKQNGNAALDDKLIEDMLGSKAIEEITIQPPNQSINKGCRKRIVGAAEKSLGGKKRQKRECKTCHEVAFHDSRNCPSKK